MDKEKPTSLGIIQVIPDEFSNIATPVEIEVKYMTRTVPVVVDNGLSPSLIGNLVLEEGEIP